MSTTTKPTSDKNLYQRIRSVMEDVEYLQKDKEISTGGSGSYKALSEETVTKNVREAMIRHGLVILPIAQEHHLVDHVRGPGKIVSVSTVNATYKIVNVDNPTEFELLASAGTGVDSQDKGVGKAQTYAYKYLLLRTFGIATGKDTDSVGNAELEREQAAEQQKAIGVAIKQLEAAVDVEELKRVGVKEYMDDPKYKAAALAAAERVKASKAAPATVAVGSAAAANAGEAEAPAYASEAQKQEIVHLLNNPTITREEKTKNLLGINKLTEAQADTKITKLVQAIEQREGAQTPA